MNTTIEYTNLNGFDNNSQQHIMAALAEKPEACYVSMAIDNTKKTTRALD